VDHLEERFRHTHIHSSNYPVWTRLMFPRYIHECLDGFHFEACGAICNVLYLIYMGFFACLFLAGAGGSFILLHLHLHKGGYLISSFFTLAVLLLMNTVMTRATARDQSLLQ
jgi:hypothetical protein